MTSLRRVTATTTVGRSGDADAGLARGGSVDPRAIRAQVALPARLEGDPTITVSAPPTPATRLAPGEDAGTPLTLVDGAATAVTLGRFGQVRARLVVRTGASSSARDVSTDLQLGRVRVDRARGTRLREVVVDGWRIDVEMEFERRAVLRERARRGEGPAARRGSAEVRAIIPGRVVAVSVVAGDSVEAGQQVLVVEAMKMQNELRAPREGSVERIGVAVGDTIEVGDLLIVIH
jgi:3-methylcrotonyl-CoA carboxylase alpha subunit